MADKLAADAKFIELVNLVRNDELKFRNLSLEDRKLFIKYVHENRTFDVINLYAKCGIDFEKTSLQKKGIIAELNNKYELSKRSDKKEIVKSALLKVGPTFAECLNGLMAGLMACEVFTGDAYFYCFWAVDAIYLGCIAVMD